VKSYAGNDAPPRRQVMATLHGLAAGQHGVLSRAQLLDAGLSGHRIDNLVKRGLLVLLHRGVYQVGPIAQPHAAKMAAVLAAGGRAVVSGRHGAELWKLPLETAPPPSVELINLGWKSQRAHIQGSRARLLEDDEITTIEGIPVTSAARTLLDLGASASPSELERALAFAERERLVTLDELQALVNRYPRHAGRRVLAQLLDGASEPALTLSEAEARLLALLRRTHIPPPATNVWVYGCKVDMYWEEAKLVVEIDGFAFHSTRPAFERDRERTNLLSAHGIRVMRVTWRQIVDGYAAVAMIAQALARTPPK
jgi:very-short-patch-repair endonuclease